MGRLTSILSLAYSIFLDRFSLSWLHLVVDDDDDDGDQEMPVEGKVASML